MAEKAHGWGIYAFVWAGLLGLTAATYAAARVDMGPFNLVVALSIAAVKASLVVFFFMHLKDHAATTRAVMALCVAFVALLASLTVADVATRFPWANPGQPQTSSRR